MTSILLLSLALLTAGPARAADAKPADQTTLELVEYFLKTPTDEANPKLVQPFLAVDPETLPKKLRGKTKAKQLQISTLIKVHDVKKQGVLIQPQEGCTEKEFVLPLAQAGFYIDSVGYEEITEEELDYVKKRTKCEEVDLGCRFSLKIFYTKPKERRLAFYQTDPIMSVVAEARGKKAGGNTNFFSAMSVTCLH